MPASTENLNSRQAQALTALLSEPTLEAAAGAARVNERTLRRWLKEPAFAEAYRTARRETLAHATARLQATASEAADTLRELLAEGTPPAVRLGAARAILDAAVKASELEDLADRLADVERVLAETQEQAAGRNGRGW